MCVWTLGSVILPQLAFPREGNPGFPMGVIPLWDNTTGNIYKSNVNGLAGNVTGLAGFRVGVLLCKPGSGLASLQAAEDFCASQLRTLSSQSAAR